MQRIEISVIVPAYNAEKTIENTIESILKQTFGFFEIIIVNDGSTDDTARILKALKESDARIIIAEQQNAGPSAARNRALSMARGEWIQFVDADDYLEPEMMQQLVSEAGEADIVITGYQKCQVARNETVTRTLQPQYLAKREDIAKYLLGMKTADQKDLSLNYLWNRLIRRKLITDHHLTFDENTRLGEDFLFNTETWKYAKAIKMIPGAPYHYMIRGNDSLVGQFDIQETNRRKKVYSAFCSLFEHYDIIETGKRIVQFHEGRYCWHSMKRIRLKTCHLTRHEKIQYVAGFLEEPHSECLTAFFEKQKGLTAALKRTLVRRKKAGLLTAFIQLPINKGL